MHLLYLNIDIEKGIVGVGECTLIIESWYNGQPFMDKRIKMNTYNMITTTERVKLGRITFDLSWDPKLGRRGFTGILVKPKKQNVASADLCIAINSY